MGTFRGRVDLSRSAPTAFTVFHIEDDCLWASVVAQLFNEWSEVCHVGTATNGRDGIARCREKHPAIVLLDLGLPDINGFVVLDQLNALSNPPLVLLLTCRTDEALLNRLGSGGIAGLIWKGRHFADQLRPALAAVAAGSGYFPPEVREAVSRFRRTPDAFFKILSPWELRLVSSLALGLKDGDIAAETGCCCGTIRNHWHNIAGKLGLGDRWDLQHWAEAKGFGPGLRRCRRLQHRPVKLIFRANCPNTEIELGASAVRTSAAELHPVRRRLGADGLLRRSTQLPPPS